MKTFFLCLVIFSFANLHSQSYIGHSIDNYSGIHSVIYNPASVVSSPFRTDINLASVSGFGGSDYYEVNVSDVVEPDDGFDFDDEAERLPSNSNNFFINTDVLGPSFMFNLNKKNSIGLITRARGFFNVNNINGELYENIERGFDTDEDFTFDSSNLSSTVHAWSEIGLTYGRILIDKPKNMLSGGVTLKYLLGAGSFFTNTPGVKGEYTASTETIDSQGSINIGRAQGFDQNDIDYDNLNSGFGFDVGVEYEWHPEREKDSTRFYQDPYKLKIAVSITDIGSITYDNVELTNFDLNDSVSLNDYEEVEDFLENNYEETSEDKSIAFELPTALHVLFDYRLAKKWLISAQADVSLVSNTKIQANRVINNYTLAPRFESKWLTLFVPASLREYDDFVMGAGLRLGPFTVGSGSIMSSLFLDDSTTVDLFAGLKIPIYRK